MIRKYSLKLGLFNGFLKNFPFNYGLLKIDLALKKDSTIGNVYYLKKKNPINIE